MQAIVFDGGSLRVVDDRAPPLPGEVRVRVLRAGICATDLALRRGYMGFAGVPGHEFVGVAMDGPLAGQRVVGEINAACGRCVACAEGLGRHCPSRTVLGIVGRDGAFAEFLALPAANLHAVPDGIPTDVAVFAEPLAAALEILEQVAVVAGPAAVVGDGKLGILCAHALASAGAEVTVAGHHPERAALLPPGARHVRDLGSSRYPLLVEATGRPQTLAAVVRNVIPRGTLVLKTTCEQPSTIDLAPIVVDELTLIGSRCGPFAPALARLPALHLTPLIAARYALRDAERAFAHAATPGTLKVLFDIA